MAAAITTTQVSKAAGELASMRRSLASWLKYRMINDRVLAGTQPNLKTPPAYAQRVIASSRDLAAEQDLAEKLHALLEQLMPDAQLPNPRAPNGAVELALIALSGGSPTLSNASAQGAGPAWMWPVMIVGGLLLAVTTAIKSSADVAKDAEEKACIRAGACTDYGFWLKAGGLAMLAWFAWRELGVGDLVRGHLKRRG